MQMSDVVAMSTNDKEPQNLFKTELMFQNVAHFILRDTKSNNLVTKKHDLYYL